MAFKILPKTPIYTALSKMGKELFQPDGIFYWSGRAKKEAEFNATIGTAVGPETDFIEGGRTKNVAYYLPLIKKYITIEPEKLVDYAPINGMPDLRKIWANWVIFKGKTNSNLPSGNIDLTNKITLPVICSGVTHAISILGDLFLDTGESMIMPNKSWENYDSIFNQHIGAKIETFQFFKGDSFNIESLISVMNKVAERQSKIVMILNFPNNPTGYCPKPKEVSEIVNNMVKFCEDKRKPVVILCDDAYEAYVYTTDRVVQSIFYELVDKHPLLIPIKMDGSSKEMLMYGARIAAITLGLNSNWGSKEELVELDKEWDNKMQAMIRTTISNSNHFCQEILLDMLKNGFDPILNSRKKIIQLMIDRYNAVEQALLKYPNPKMTMDPAGGGYFVFFNIEGIDATKLADHLLTKYKVGIIPASNPKEGINGLRFAFCSVVPAYIDECIKRIDLAIKDFSQ